MSNFKIDRISFLITLLASALCITETFASDTPTPAPNPEKNNHSRISLRHIESGGVGYNKGYSTLAGFFALDPANHHLTPFLDLRGHVFDNGYLAANTGIGLRWIADRRIYGLNSYYDVRNTQSIFYNQLGLGFETLGTFWDFRANGYLPFGNKTATDGNAKFNAFYGHQMTISQPYQYSMTGVDAELGVPFVRYKWATLYAAAGTYYFNGELGTSTLGAKVRLKADLGQYVGLEVSDTYDQMFHNNFQVQLTLTLPLEKKSSESKTRYAPRNRMFEDVNRDEIIVAGNSNQISVAINPATGQPYYFVFVDNTSHSAGTFESPYHTLASAQANSAVNDIIYVFPGDGTTTGMDSGIILKSGQKLWGSGTNQQIQTSQGNVIVPAHSSSAPQITNSGGSGVILAANNQISGMTIKNVTDNGIYGLNPQNVQIYSTTIDNSISDLIHLEYTESGSVDLNNLTLTNAQISAIFIQSTGPTFVGSVNNSIIQGSLTRYIDASFTGQTTFRFTQNSLDNNYASLFDFSGPSYLLISDNLITNSTSPSEQPISIATHASVGSFTATIENNTISNSTTGAIHLAIQDTASANVSIMNNTINQNGTGSKGSLLGSAILIDPNTTTTTNLNVVLAGNSMSNNSGVVFAAANGGFNQLTISATDNYINNNAAGAFIFDNTATSLSFSATGNTITNGADHAILTAGGRLISTVNMTLSNNQITDNKNLVSPSNGVNGVSLNHDGTTVNFTATNNNISNNSGTGIIFYSSSEFETVNATINNNIITNNQNVASDPGGGGIDLEQYKNLSSAIRNNNLSDNASYGLYISTTIPTSAVCLNLSGNDSNLGYYLANDDGSGSVFNLSPLDVATVNTGTITTSGTITPVTGCP